MKSLFVVFFSLSLFISFINAQTTITMGGRKIPGEEHFTLITSGALTSPDRFFANNYDASNGLSFGIGLAVTPEGMSNVHVGTFYIRYNRDLFNLNQQIRGTFGIDNGATATISSINIGGSVGLPLVLSKHFVLSPFFGMGWGTAWFSMDNETYNKLGNSTFTELGNKKNKLKYNSYTEFGLMIGGINHLSLQYSYNLVNIESAWVVGHSMISGIVGYVIGSGMDILGKALPKDIRNSTVYNILNIAYKIGASIFWYNFTYDHHNWPFNDAPPLRYRRQVVTLNVYF